jgi:endoglucanase
VVCIFNPEITVSRGMSMNDSLKILAICSALGLMGCTQFSTPVDANSSTVALNPRDLASQGSASPNGTTLPLQAEIVDSSGNTFTLVSGHVYINGKLPVSSNNVSLALYYNGVVYIKIGSSWLSWTNSEWVYIGNSPPQSPEGTTIPSASVIVDSSGDVFTLSAGHVYINGALPVSSDNVYLVLYYNNTVYIKIGSSWLSWTNSGWVYFGSSAPHSPQGTTIPSATVIVDNSGNVFTLAAGHAYINGGLPVSSNNVTLVLYYNNVVYIKIGSSWLLWTGSAWGFYGSDPRPATCNGDDITGGKTGLNSYLLPSGYLHTVGNQITDTSGNPVRLACISYYDFVNISQDVAGMKVDGFNCIRIPYHNATLSADLATIDQIVAAAAVNGLKVIIDHHGDEGYNGSSCDSQQANGLWIDSGPGTNNTNGCGVTGTVTAQVFQNNWVSIASHYNGNSTVIGFDLDNEPLAYSGQSVWGGGGPTDIRQMYETVGNAILAVNPGVLIIAEGPQNYSHCFNGTGTCPEGDLSMVGTLPVTLNVPMRVVYSVHEYPDKVSGITPDSGSAAITRMNNAWGNIVTKNTAPVWIGEMGVISPLSSNPEESTWAATIIPYLNGKDGAQGGPTFSGSQLPIGTDWWTWGNSSTGVTSGLGVLTGTTPTPAVQVLTEQLMFAPMGCE